MSNEVKVIQPSGRLDVTTAADFRRQVNDIASATSSPKYLLVDLQEITFMDSSGLGALVSALKSIRNSNGEMVICGANDQVQMLFELTSMTKIFKIYPTIDDFNATLS
ncbi:STAS domain-containing protein [Pseudanabaena sp. ABRG5-3]|uniref:STAS domain-containing protein n=1 Tax=Pseudanabaena sp. ABRG5-3 TaxID=685565 RepID=UPI000DC6EB44|nr:STAS domain-containing protein [Pseudanabaena sp. ABRG5-3]BBC25712.1 anti-sigma-factor antagonist [Pseudanabaena sp. ABRG5-3]